MGDGIRFFSKGDVEHTLRDTWAKTAKKGAGNPPKAKNPNKKNKKKKKDSE